MPGRAVLARIASMTGPESNTTDRPSSKSVAVIRSGTAVSSKSRYGSRAVRNFRQQRGEKNPPFRNSVRALENTFSGKMSRARTSHHRLRSSSTVSSDGSAAR